MKSKKALRYIPSFLWLITITIVSGFPGDKVPQVPVWQFDKLVHSFIYAILSITLIISFYSFYTNANHRVKTIVLIVIFGIFYGGVMEILQHYIFINRSGNWFDFIANTIGTVLGVLIFPFVIKLLPMNKWFKL